MPFKTRPFNNWTTIQPSITRQVRYSEPHRKKTKNIEKFHSSLKFYLPIMKPNPETISVPAKTDASLPGYMTIRMPRIEPQAAASETPPINLKQRYKINFE